MAALLALLPSAACTVIGPTVAAHPGSGKSPAAFDADRRGCMAEMDRQLQPVANRANTLGTAPSQIAANNRWLQAEYDRGFVVCMTARGDIVLEPGPSFADQVVPTAAPFIRTAAADGASGTLPGGWQPLRLSFHARSGQPRDENDALWPREIANPVSGPGGTLPIYSIRFGDKARTVLLSIAGQGEPTCDNGPNDVNATRDYALCPGKLALIEDGRPTAVRATGSLCAESINNGVQPGAPDWKDPKLWGTRGRYDAAAGTIELVTMQSGRPEPACAKRLRVR